MSFDNTGQAASWPPRKPEAPRRVQCYAHRDIKKGEEFEVALWPNQTENEKAPDLKGKVQDKWIPQERSSARTPHHENRTSREDWMRQQEDPSDPIPF